MSKPGDLTTICKVCGGFLIKCLIWGHIKGVKHDHT